MDPASCRQRLDPAAETTMAGAGSVWGNNRGEGRGPAWWSAEEQGRESPAGRRRAGVRVLWPGPGPCQGPVEVPQDSAWPGHSVSPRPGWEGEGLGCLPVPDPARSCRV